MNILTEEELKERNRLLVLENDELNARDIENKQDITKLTTLLRLIALKITDVEVLDMVTPVVLEIFERRAKEMLSHD